MEHLTSFQKLKMIFARELNVRVEVYIAFDLIFLYYLIKSSFFFKKVYGLDIRKYITSTHYVYSLFLKTINSKNIFMLKLVKKYYIQRSYSGGFVDICGNSGSLIYYYDINSLYPYMMLKNIPRKECHWQEGNFNFNFFFGFLEVTILYRPLYYPELNKKLREDTCVIFSEELKFIEKLGYKYKINNFLQFSVGRKIFNNLIYHFYALKDTKKDNFMKLMSKNLLNSLYGRFSLKISKENSNYISAAVSSYARIEIYQYKILQNYLYSDTDSVFTFLPLRKKYISRKIGMLKLEDKINSIQILKEK